MPRQTTTYDILFSCPGDVVSHINMVRKAIDSFNETTGMEHQVTFMLRHWSISSYTESGKSGQASINDQFIKKCDAAIAVFGDKFGTPTEEWRSGTEEEIEIFLNEKKQVFMYFYEGGKSKDADPDELKKVREFKKKYSPRGVHASYQNEDQLTSIVKDHLDKWFLHKGKCLLSDDSTIKSKNIQPKSKQLPQNTFSFKTYNEGKIYDKIFFSKLKFPFDVEKTQANIKKLIEKISSIAIEKTSLKSNEMQELCIVDADEKNIIIEYAKKRKIFLPKDFFNLGNLRTHLFNGMVGSDGEKEKYEFIGVLAKNVKEAMVQDFLVKKLNGLKILWGVVINESNQEGKDVSITLEMKKNNFLSLNEIFLSLEKVLRKIVNRDFLKKNFPNFDASDYFHGVGNLFSSEYPSDKEYVDTLNNFFDYSISERDDVVCLKYYIGCIKIGGKRYMPLPIFFNESSNEVSLTYRILASNIKQCFEKTLK